ncbi:FAD:protein FMN transferase [Tropicimonas sp. IMCC34043]|uniref:FAD:protein FMN transferase n=1 Tax=Tropicimonas sp. IMCC34043 TaxID=2248760 RepID=UPI000E28803F|nr:FAD:protein FMN transferase [Tropicimonas sp. IMCC34043]
MRILLLLPLFVALSGCWPDSAGRVLKLSGETMGTTYHITAVDVPKRVSEEDLSQAVDATLAAVNHAMSNWDKTSEVSLFNADASTDPIAISPELAQVIAAANKVHALSEGKFDVTLSPLIELWGFGTRKPEDPVPSDSDIAVALAHVGQGGLLVLDGQTLAKTDPAVSVNLSAIAKGYGGDAVAKTLRDQGIERYMIEIGGDLVAAGTNEAGDPWQIGIESPDTGSHSLEMVVPVSDLGMATSGDYRNFFEQDGVRYSHLIDPTTGRPITHRATSVTVLAENGMMADALATAMIVMGEDEGMKVAAANDLAVFFISRAEGPDEAYLKHESPAFEKLLAGE